MFERELTDEELKGLAEHLNEFAWALFGGKTKAYIITSSAYGQKQQESTEALHKHGVKNWRFWDDNFNNRTIGFIVGIIFSIVTYACF